MTTSSPAASAAGELSRERDRVVQRLRSMALDAIPAERVLVTAQRLADLAAEADGDARTEGGPRRTVPALAPYAAGDQVAVLTGEVLALAETLDPGAAHDLLTAATAVLAGLRHDLSAPGKGPGLPAADTRLDRARTIRNQPHADQPPEPRRALRARYRAQPGLLSRRPGLPAADDGARGLHRRGLPAGPGVDERPRPRPVRHRRRGRAVRRGPDDRRPLPPGLGGRHVAGPGRPVASS